MEHTLGVLDKKTIAAVFGVLILVLVEHTLGDGRESCWNGEQPVLILVLVEHTLGVDVDFELQRA